MSKLYRGIARAMGSLLISLTLHQAFAQMDKDFNSFSFDHIKVMDGLSQSWATSIEQDHQGFIWIGTADGLNRYDARTFKVYRANDYDTTTLFSSHINDIFTDTQKRIWISATEGLSLYNQQFDNFTRIRVANRGNRSGRLLVNRVAEDKKGVLWLTGYDGLYSYNPVGDSDGTPGGTPGAKRQEIREILSPEEIRQMGYRKTKAIFFDSRELLWVGVHNGLILMDFNRDRIIQSFVPLPASEAGDPGLVNDIVEFPEGKLWLATETGGLFSYDLNRKEFERFTENEGLIHNNVRKLYLDREKEVLWIGTRNGLSIYHPATNSFQNFQHRTDNPVSLSDNSIHSIFKDRDGTFWLGTYNGGVNIYSESFFKIKTYKAEKKNEGLSYKVVSSVNEVAPGQFLIGTEGGGMNFYNSKTGSYEHFQHDVNDSTSLSHNNIKCIFKDRDGVFWIGTSGGGISTYDPSKGTFRKFGREEIGIKSRGGWIYSIDQDINGRLWFGLFEGGLAWYDKNTGEFGHFLASDDETFKFNAIRKVLVDSRNRIWVGTDAGLCLYDQEKNSFHPFFKNINTEGSLQSNVIYSIYEDHKNQIWIGTLQGGLSKYNEETQLFETYRVKDGLPGDNVFGILEDDNGNLWLSTNSGISKFNPETKAFKNFTTQDGLLDMEYSYNSYFKSSTGELFFGGKNGLVSFNPNVIRENKSIPPVVVTDIRLFNKPVAIGGDDAILKSQISQTNHLVFDYTHNVFTLSFSVLNYVKSSKNKYAYRLDGLEDEWNYVKTPSATYTNLEPGTYTFLVKGANNDGYWNTVPTAMKITAREAPWKTSWAYMGYSAILLTAIFVLVRYQRIKVTLEHDLKLREFENKRQKELSQAKLKFFTDVSHEIRTPLTLMLTPLENMISEYRSEPVLHKQLLLVKNNASRLLRLINQLLDFRKRESGKAKLSITEGNFIRFLREIAVAFEQEAVKRNISFIFKTDSEELPLYYDRDEMEKVFFNLISNAFKYTPDSERIVVSVSSGEMVQFKDAAPVDTVRIEVKDSGIGINAEDIERVFERYYEADHSGINSLSTGIGLSLSKSIVKAHKGLIRCSSVKSNGEKNCTTFTVFLRKGKSHFNQNDIIDNFRDSEQIENYEEMLGPLNTTESVSYSEQAADKNGQKQWETLLIAEDNDEIRAFLVSHLSNKYSVLEARNGAEALEIACETIPDLVISDVIMPEVDGMRLCAELKNDERTSHIPIIILTARTSLIHKVEGIDTGADDYLIKPFNLELLKAKIRSLIRTREALRKKYSREITLQPENIVVSSPNEKFLNRLKSLIDENIANSDFGVNHVIKEIGMSRPVLYRKIKAITNMSIFDFINTYRLNKAAAILKTQQFNISEIAFQVGFSDPKYFSKAFRKKFGMSPSEYMAAEAKNHEIAV